MLARFIQMFLFFFVYSTTGCEHYKYQQIVKSPGLHILCIASGSKPNSISVSALVEALKEVKFDYNSTRGDIFPFMKHLHSIVGSTNYRPPTSWRAFNKIGQSIFSVDSLIYHNTVFIHTNGHWLWPGVREGYVQYTVERVKLTTLSIRPLVFRAHQFLSYEECDQIKTLSEPYMVASKTSKMDKDKGKADTEWRTSTQYFLPSSGNPVVQNIDYKVAALTRTRIFQQEFVVSNNCSILLFIMTLSFFVLSSKFCDICRLKSTISITITLISVSMLTMPE